LITSLTAVTTNLKKRSCLIFAGAFFLLLSGCAINPNQTEMVSAQSNVATLQAHLATIEKIQAFHVKGRIGVQTQPNGFSGGLDWQHTNERDEIAIFSPLGSQVASIIKRVNGVTLTDNKGQSVTEKDTATLTQNTLGWQLPLDGLSDWVLGRPRKSAITEIRWDAEGKLRKLAQDDWQIEYLEYKTIDRYRLPVKLNLMHPNVTIKLILQEQKIQ
jgi:outer membrane lipoprotein LolB